MLVIMPVKIVQFMFKDCFASCAAFVTEVGRYVDTNSSATKEPGGSVHGERAHFRRLVLGCIEATFSKQILK